MVLLAVRTQGEPEDQFGRRALRAVLVGAGIGRFAVFAVDPAVAVGIGVEGVEKVRVPRAAAEKPPGSLLRMAPPELFRIIVCGGGGPFGLFPQMGSRYARSW